MSDHDANEADALEQATSLSVPLPPPDDERTPPRLYVDDASRLAPDAPVPDALDQSDEVPFDDDDLRG